MKFIWTFPFESHGSYRLKKRGTLRVFIKTFDVEVVEKIIEKDKLDQKLHSYVDQKNNCLAKSKKLLLKKSLTDSMTKPKEFLKISPKIFVSFLEFNWKF